MARVLFPALLLAAVLAVPVLAAKGRDVHVTRDIQYGNAGGERLLLDVYDPGGGGQRPGLIAIHGGSWSHGDKSDIPAEHFARRGHVVFAINYRLAPEDPYPAAVHDVETAVGWVRAHAQEYRVDPDRIWALGGSAGGHLAALLATRGDAGIRVAVSYSGPMDLELLGESGGELEQAVTTFLGCKRWDGRCRAVARRASPITHVDGGDAPLYVAHGANERIPFAGASAMAKALKEEGVPHRLHKVPGDRHSFQYLEAVIHPSTAFASRQMVGPLPSAGSGTGSGSGSTGPGSDQPSPGDGALGREEGKGESRSGDRDDETREEPRPAAAPSPAGPGAERPGGYGWVIFLIVVATVGGAVIVALVVFREPPEGP
jgi:acetyl esterase